MRYLQPKNQWLRKQGGGSLAELMVGMVIAIVASVAIFSAFSNFEWQKARTVSGSEAQENGLMSMSVLAEDLRNAGSGISDPAQLTCSDIYSYVDGAAIPNLDFTPVTVVDGGATGSDQILARSSSNFLGSLSTVLQTPYNPGDDNLTVLRSIGYIPDTVGLATGSFGLVSNGSECAVFRVTGSMYGGLTLLTEATTSPNYNPPASYKLSHNWPDYVVGSKVFDISGLRTRTYSVNGQKQLQMVESSPWGASTTTLLAENVVMLKAQYGIAPVGTSNVTRWVSATGVTWATPSVADRNRIKAIRLAVIARSKFPEGQVVTSSCTNTSGVVNVGPCVWPDTSADPAPRIDLSSGNPKWNKYRYKVYQMVVPLRNVIWADV